MVSAMTVSDHAVPIPVNHKMRLSAECRLDKVRERLLVARDALDIDDSSQQTREIGVRAERFRR